MDGLTEAGLQDLLDAMEGIVYVTSLTGEIVAYGRGHWDSFARANRGDNLLDPDAVCGRRLVEFLTGSQVRRAYEAAVELVVSQRELAVSYTYRCDAPDLQRNLRLAISPLYSQGKMVGLLHQSIILQEQRRAPVHLLSLRSEQENPAASTDLITICSYCKNVQRPGLGLGGERIWISPESYYEQDGDAYALISHGVCPECLVNILQPLLDRLRPSLEEEVEERRPDAPFRLPKTGSADYFPPE